MADSKILTQQEMALRRRARRRLVGAAALALAAVVVLPMLFDSEPKPLGPDVEVRIPAKDTPFEATTGVPVAEPPTAGNEPPPQEAEPTLPPVSPKAAEGAMPSAEGDKPKSEGASPQAAAKPAESVGKPAVSVAPVKPPINTTQPAGARDAKPAEPSAEPVKAPAAPAKATPQPPEKGYFLQLGAFASEANARQLQGKAQAAGFRTALHEAGGQFRVRVGPIVEQEKALDYQAQLKAKGFSPVLINP